MPELPAKQEHVGRLVRFWDDEWKIVGINYLGDYDIEMRRDTPEGPQMVSSSCRLGLPEDHRHYAELIEPKSSHTPGPWSRSGDLIVGAPEPRPNPKVEPHPHAVAKLCWDFDGDTGANGDLPWSIAKENQKLIAAAPELLEALQDLVDKINDAGWHPEITETAREVIERATKG